MRSTLSAIALVTAVGCGPTLTKAGALVRDIQPEASSRCRYLGAVEGLQGNGTTSDENEAGATNDVKNRVAGLGGNAFVVRERTRSMWGVIIRADAYLCPSWEPVHGLPPG